MKCKEVIWAGMYVQDVEKSVAFYADVLGLTLRRKGDGWASFDAQNGARFDLLGGGTASTSAKKPEQQPLCMGFRVDDLDSAVQELKSKGVTLVGDITEFRGERWVQFCDPEGNLLELKQIPQ